LVWIGGQYTSGLQSLVEVCELRSSDELGLASIVLRLLLGKLTVERGYEAELGLGLDDVGRKSSLLILWVLGHAEARQIGNVALIRSAATRR